jgi:hypothetical protein
VSCLNTKPTKPTESGNTDLLEVATGSFGFLSKEYGLRLVESDDHLIRYQNTKVFLNISLGRASLEIKVEIGLLPNQYDDAEHKFLLTEIIELLGNRNETEYSYYQGITREQLQKNLPILAGLVKKYAGDVLKGDYLVIQNLERLRFDSSFGFVKEDRLDHDNYD